MSLRAEKGMSAKDATEVNKILNVEPEPEPIEVSVVKNVLKWKTKGKQDKMQFKINIPKKFANALNMDKVEFTARFILKKEKVGDSIVPKLIAEIIPKNGAS